MLTRRAKQPGWPPQLLAVAESRRFLSSVPFLVASAFRWVGRTSLSSPGLLLYYVLDYYVASQTSREGMREWRRERGSWRELSFTEMMMSAPCECPALARNPPSAMQQESN